MFVTLLSALSFAQTPDPTAWTPLPGDEEATYAYRLLETDTGGDVRRLVLRLTPARAREFAHGEMAYDLDCPARTLTILSVRSLDAAGAELQAVDVPAEFRTADPVYAEDGPTAALYARLCPDGEPLPPAPAAPPPPIAVAPRN